MPTECMRHLHEKPGQAQTRHLVLPFRTLSDWGPPEGRAADLEAQVGGPQTHPGNVFRGSNDAQEKLVYGTS